MEQIGGLGRRQQAVFQQRSVVDPNSPALQRLSRKRAGEKLCRSPSKYVLAAERRLCLFSRFCSDLFEPLYEVTRDPSADPKLHVFLRSVVGFDSVDDESKPEKRIWRKYPLPKQWDFATNPPYSYWSYFLYANMISLNHWRKERGFSGFGEHA